MARSVLLTPQVVTAVIRAFVATYHTAPTTAEIAARLGRNQDHVRGQLRKLAAAGVVRQMAGVGLVRPGGVWEVVDGGDGRQSSAAE